MKKNKKNFLVTGGCGFIGSHMVDKLMKLNENVIVIDNLDGGFIKNIKKHLNSKNFVFMNKDINDLKKNKIFETIDYVFHFAGKGDIVPSIEKPYDYFINNVQSTLKLLTVLNLKKIKKFVYAASSSCYGISKTPTKENHHINPLYPYALSKYQGEQLVNHWGQLYKLKCNSIRIFNAYGPRVKTTGAYGAVFGVFLKQILEKKPLTIVGDGNQKRDFLYVTDLVDAFYKVALNKKNFGEIYNLGSGKPQTINKLVELIGGKKKVYLPFRPGEPKITHANINKIIEQTGWKPKVQFNQGVKKMLNNIDYWKDAPLWDVPKIKKATKTWFEYMSKYEKK